MSRRVLRNVSAAVEVVGAFLAFFALVAVVLVLALLYAGIPLAFLYAVVRVVRLAWSGQ